jgi:hypothetical protein
MIEKVKEIINEELGVNIDKNVRKRNYVEARALYYTILKNSTNLTLSQIGNIVNKNHATVLHGIKNLQDWMDQNAYLQHAYNNVLDKIDKDFQEYTGTKDIKRKYADLKYQNFQLKRQVKRLEKQLQH